MLSAPPLVYALAVVPALLWGFAPVLDRGGMDAGGTTVQASTVVVVVDSALYWAALLALQGPDAFAELDPTTLGIFLGAGLVGTALGRLAVFAGVRRVGAAVNSAGISARPLFATILAVAFIGESVSPVTAAGIVVLVAGLVVLATSEGGDLGGWRPRDLLFPVLAAVLFAAGNVARRFGLRNAPISALEAVTLNESAALAGLVAYALATRGADAFAVPRRSYAYFAASGVLTAVALLSLFAALRHPAGRVAIVDPIAATAPLFTAGFVAVLLRGREVVSRGVLAGAALIVVGGALVAVG